MRRIEASPSGESAQTRSTATAISGSEVRLSLRPGMSNLHSRCAFQGRVSSVTA
jgi:hypothetical protein